MCPYGRAQNLSGKEMVHYPLILLRGEAEAPLPIYWPVRRVDALRRTTWPRRWVLNQRPPRIQSHGMHTGMTSSLLSPKGAGNERGNSVDHG